MSRIPPKQKFLEGREISLYEIMRDYRVDTHRRVDSRDMTNAVQAGVLTRAWDIEKECPVPRKDLLKALVAVKGESTAVVSGEAQGKAFFHRNCLFSEREIRTLWEFDPRTDRNETGRYLQQPRSFTEAEQEAPAPAPREESFEEFAIRLRQEHPWLRTRDIIYIYIRLTAPPLGFGRLRNKLINLRLGRETPLYSGKAKDCLKPAEWDQHYAALYDAFGKILEFDSPKALRDHWEESKE